MIRIQIYWKIRENTIYCILLYCLVMRSIFHVANIHIVHRSQRFYKFYIRVHISMCGGQMYSSREKWINKTFSMYHFSGKKLKASSVSGLWHAFLILEIFIIHMIVVHNISLKNVCFENFVKKTAISSKIHGNATNMINNVQVLESRDWCIKIWTRNVFFFPV